MRTFASAILYWHFLIFVERSIKFCFIVTLLAGLTDGLAIWVEALFLTPESTVWNKFLLFVFLFWTQFEKDSKLFDILLILVFRFEMSLQLCLFFILFYFFNKYNYLLLFLSSFKERKLSLYLGVWVNLSSFCFKSDNFC